MKDLGAVCLDRGELVLSDPCRRFRLLGCVLQVSDAAVVRAV
ncbi:MAG: hypothetical protein WDO73_07335 [Ignavibacteriota bacterium]